MIVNEIAKFWNPPMPRKSSCAYPSLCRICSSLFLAATWRLRVVPVSHPPPDCGRCRVSGINARLSRAVVKRADDGSDS